MIAALALLARQRVAPGAGVQLDHRRAQGGGGVERLDRGFDEQRHPDPGAAELGDKRLEMVEAADHVEAALGGALGAVLRHQATGVRTDAERHVQHRLGRRHLEIQRLRDRRLEPAHVVVVDVAAILAQMRGDAVGPGFDRQQRRPNRIGNRAAARVAHRRDVIDIHTQPQLGHGRTPCRRLARRGAGSVQPASARLPGLTAGVAASSGGSASAG